LAIVAANCSLVVLYYSLVGFFAPYVLQTNYRIPGQALSTHALLGTDELGVTFFHTALGRHISTRPQCDYDHPFVRVRPRRGGLTAGFVRSVVDPVMMRDVDVLLAFGLDPGVAMLLVLAGLGASVPVLVFAVALIPGTRHRSADQECDAQALQYH